MTVKPPKAGSLWKVSVLATPATEEAVAAILQARLGAPPASYRDEATGRLLVSVYLEKFDPSPDAMDPCLIGDLSTLPGLRQRMIVVQRLPRQDWAESWKRHFPPIEIGRALLIKPGWSRRRARPGQRVVILNPGLSFGTGQHETTAFCLRELCACRTAATQSFLDIGTGSGILAIAAAKLGYRPVEAFDYDPESVRVSAANARRNRVSHIVRPRLRDLADFPARGPRFDVIVANLTADVLATHAHRIASRLQGSGRLIVAGVLRRESRIVTKKFQRFGLTLEASEACNNWWLGKLAFRG